MHLILRLQSAYRAISSTPLVFLVLTWLFLYAAAPAVPSAVDLRGGSDAPAEQGGQRLGIDMRKLADYIHDNFYIAEHKASNIVAEAVHNGEKHSLRPELILAVIAIESNFKEKAVSPAGARGLMQVMPRSHPNAVKEIGGAHALFNPRKNISTGSKILVDCLQDSDGNVRSALLRYSGNLSNRRSHYPGKVLTIYHEMKQAADPA